MPSRSMRAAKAAQSSWKRTFGGGICGGAAAGGGCRQGVRQRGMANAKFESGRSAHGQADEVCLFNSQGFEHGGGVVGRARLGVGLGPFGYIGGRPPARRVGYAAVAARKVTQLRFPAQMVAAELVHKQDRIACAHLFVVEAHSIVGRDPWHASIAPLVPAIPAPARLCPAGCEHGLASRAVASPPACPRARAGSLCAIGVRRWDIERGLGRTPSVTIGRSLECGA
jgi:hypothetical protein